MWTTPEPESGPSITEVLDLFGARWGSNDQFGYSWGDEIEVFCPFCEDRESRKPAGRVNVLKNVYFCFSCGAGGSPRMLLDLYTDFKVVT